MPRLFILSGMRNFRVNGLPALMRGLVLCRAAHDVHALRCAFELIFYSKFGICP